MTVSRLLFKCVRGRKQAKISPKLELVVPKFPDARERVLDVAKISIFVAG